MNQELMEITSCEVCGSTSLQPVLNLGSHPLCDDLVKVDDYRQCKKYPIEILFCDNCKTAHQRFQIPKTELFPQTYHYRSRFTADVLNGMQELVQSCAKILGSLNGKKVLDVGCNDGSLLGFFEAQGAIPAGIEPTGAYKDAAAKGLPVVNDFFSQSSANFFYNDFGSPDIITFTNVFAHIEDLADVIRGLKILATPQTIIVIENHYLGAVLDKSQFDTFYHEHPRTYSASSFTHIANSLDMDLLRVEFPSRYGGNIRIVLGNKTHYEIDCIATDDVYEKEANFLDDFSLLNNRMNNWRELMTAKITDLANTHGPISAKAFPGRAAILIEMLGLDVNHIDRVYEKPGSVKIGHFLPGTRIPIVSDDEFTPQIMQQTPCMLNLAWHISSEIETYLRNSGFKGEIVDILSPEALMVSN